MQDLADILDFTEHPAGIFASSAGTKRKRKKRKKKKLPQFCYRVLTPMLLGFHCSTSSCSSGACGKQVLQAFTAALEATFVPVCVIADNWNDCAGGVISDRHPDEQCFMKQYVLRCSMWRQLGCHCGGPCRQGSGSVRIVLGVLCYPSGVSQLVLTSGGFRVDLSARGFRAHSTRIQYVPHISGVINWCFTEVVSAVVDQGHCGSCQAFAAIQAMVSKLVLTFGGLRGSVSVDRELHSFTGTYCCYGCDDGWSEGAHVHLSTDAGLTSSFYVPFVLCLTEETASMVCPIEKVANITGEFDWGGNSRWCAATFMWARIALSLSPWRGAEADG